MKLLFFPLPMRIFNVCTKYWPVQSKQVTSSTLKIPLRQYFHESLGHVVRKEGIRPDPDKINAFLNFSRPLSQNELPSFLGLACYFLCFIRNFATMALPFNKLLTYGSPFFWTENGETAFKILKDALTSAPVLCHVDESAPAILHTGSTGHGHAVVLQRTDAS